jgi:anti-sigma-K factor RskA
MRRASVAVFLAVLLFGLAAWAEDIPLVASSQVPAASGKLSYEHDRNGNVKFKVSTKNLAAPTQLTPSKNAYVVWIEPRGQQPQSAGVLTVNDKLEGSLSATTPYKTFDVVVTAEDNPTVTQPSGPDILHGTVQVR